ncbi:uncharacterized protein [Epargyreus clarus]|uniref:uncharacterized protein n=1 Tax=Epargyreus clarus TaxID=520877 RepID=UPI003C2FD03C
MYKSYIYSSRKVSLIGYVDLHPINLHLKSSSTDNMAFKLIVLPFLTALVAVNLIFAEGFGLPSSGDGNSSDPSSALSGLLSQLPFPLPFGSRQERSAEPEESDDGEHQNRFFFASRVACNYTAQGGTTCSSCRQALACYPNNVGRLRTCRGFLSYCNNGRCSFIPGPQCANSTSG